MNARNALAVLTLAGLASPALAQPGVDYTILGSISGTWSEKPWPNVQYVPGDTRWLYFDFAGHGSVMLGDTSNSWLFHDGTVSRVRNAGQQIPGLPEGILWRTFSAAPNNFFIIPRPDGYVMMGEPGGGATTQAIRTSASGFELTMITMAVSDGGDTLRYGDDLSLLLEHDGGNLEILPANSGAWSLYPQWSVFTFISNRSMTLGQTPDGRVLGIARRSDPWPWNFFLFVADPATRSARPIVAEGDPAPPYGVLNLFSPDGNHCGVADDGTVLLSASIRRDDGVSVVGDWTVTTDGHWRQVFAQGQDLEILPAGVRLASSSLRRPVINRDGRVASLKILTGAGVSAGNDTAILAWDPESGPRLIAREGDQVPGEPAGTLYTNLNTVFLSDHGDIAFEDDNAIYLHHPLVGTVTVARVGVPVADGIATDFPPTRVGTSYYSGTWRVRSTPIRGGATYLDGDGVLYFYANCAPHYIAYSARLRPPCPADFNADGFVDFFDYSDFVSCFETGECPPGQSADANHDGFVDFFDYADFVELFEGGC